MMVRLMRMISSMATTEISSLVLASTDRPGESWVRVVILPVPGYYITRVIVQLRFFQISKYALTLCVEHAFQDVSKLSPTGPVKDAMKLQGRFRGAETACCQKGRSPN
jgi:hypothetical protein